MSSGRAAPVRLRRVLDQLRLLVAEHDGTVRRAEIFADAGTVACLPETVTHRSATNHPTYAAALVRSSSRRSRCISGSPRDCPARNWSAQAASAKLRQGDAGALLVYRVEAGAGYPSGPVNHARPDTIAGWLDRPGLLCQTGSAKRRSPRAGSMSEPPAQARRICRVRSSWYSSATKGCRSTCAAICRKAAMRSAAPKPTSGFETKSRIHRPGIFGCTLRQLELRAHVSALGVDLPQCLLVHLADAGARDRVDQPDRVGHCISSRSGPSRRNAPHARGAAAASRRPPHPL